MPSEQQPLFGPADYELLKRLQRRIVDARSKCEQGHACGIDVSNEMMALEAMNEFLSAFETNFMTPPPHGVTVIQE